jgi:hypothetical protein
LFYGRIVYYASALWKMSIQPEVFVGFADDASRHTQRLSSIAWVILMPTGQLVSSGGAYLGEETNNVVEYSVVI